MKETAPWDEIERRLERVRKFAGMMDDRFSIPGTRIRFGIDSMVGLLPGVGDFATAVAGLWLVREAYRLKVSSIILIRMIVNVVIDSTLGVIPVVGDFFDVYWKSNRRNAELLEKALRDRSARK
jgi:hypothetical protein